MQEEKSLTVLQEEVKSELANREVFNTLLATTFKGLTEMKMKEAIMDGMIRGFTFKDFRERNVYAIPYSNGYSLVTSIDYARKIGAKSGVVGMDEPIYGEDPDLGEVKGGVWCSVTVHKRQPDGTIGDFTSKVYFEEFSTHKNLWSKEVGKPRVMIAKVAEMHALRKACPELSKMYAEEELEKTEEKPALLTDSLKTEWKAKLEACTTMDELGTAWAKMPAELKADADIQIIAGTMKAKVAKPAESAPAATNENTTVQ